MGCIDKYNGILLSHKKEWNNAICSNMDGPRDDHNKWNKPDREKTNSIWYCLSLKEDTNELIYKTETDQHRKQIYGYQRRKQVGERLGLTYTHCYI